MLRIGPSGYWSTPADDYVIWTDIQTTSGGIAVFRPLTNESMPLFSQIYSAQLTGIRSTNDPTAIPVCALKSISADLGTVTANVSIGTTLLVLGAVLLAAPDGISVYCVIHGV